MSISFSDVSYFFFFHRRIGCFGSILLLLCSVALTDLTSSSTQARNLVNIEKNLLSELRTIPENELARQFAKKIEPKIPDFLKENLSETYDIMDDNTPAAVYMAHPINVLMITKRLAVDWALFLNDLESQFPGLKSTTFSFLTQPTRVYLPNGNDISEIYISIELLRSFYSLQIEDFNQGKLLKGKSVKLHQTMNAADFYHIATNMFHKRDNWVAAKIWLLESIKRCQVITDATKEECNFTASSYDYLSWIEYNYYNFDIAIDYTNKWLQLAPNDERAIKNLEYYRQMNVSKPVDPNDNKPSLEKILSQSGGSEQLYIELRNLSMEYSKDSDLLEHEIVKKICTESISLWEEKENHEKLVCHKKISNGFIGLFDPILVEIISDDPKVFVFRNIINQADIDVIKNISINRLRRATVKNPITGATETAAYRTSKSAWFEAWEHAAVKRIYDKVERATGLSLEFSESLQVGNYGVGGFYDLHFDFSRLSEAHISQEFNINGNRIATILIYMSDVEQGGDTAFSRLGISFHPQNGDALFWYNLHSDGTGDARTRHIACPVLYGNKWVSNYWIRMKGQEFRRPCELFPIGGI